MMVLLIWTMLTRRHRVQVSIMLLGPLMDKLSLW